MWQARLEDLTIARKERHAVAQAHHRTPRSRHSTSELHLSTGSEDGAACFDNFDNIGARDDTLARIRELATGLGANFDGHAVSTLPRWVRRQIFALTHTFARWLGADDLRVEHCYVGRRRRRFVAICDRNSNSAHGRCCVQPRDSVPQSEP